MMWAKVYAEVGWSPLLDVPIQYASTVLIPESVWLGIAQAARGEGREINLETL